MTLMTAKRRCSIPRTISESWSKAARSLASWLSRGGCQKRIYEGLELWSVHALNRNSESFFDGTTRALEIIKNTDHLRWKRLITSVNVITPISQGRLASYHHYLRMCMVHPRMLNLRSTDDLLWYAVVLAHEGCHAYLMKKGIPWNRKTHRRVEAICLEDAIHLAQKMAPERDDWVQQLRKSIRQYSTR